MKDRPILFSGPMVRAIIDGRKTQTRRIVKPQPPDRWNRVLFVKGVAQWMYQIPACDHHDVKCPYGKPGDRLWVRESLILKHADTPIEQWCYKADEAPIHILGIDNVRCSQMVVWAHHKEGTSCSAIHMPRWASRITLEIADIRVQRVQEISEEDARAEGIAGNGYADLRPDGELRDGPSIKYRADFHDLWNSINGPESWNANVWVWAISFQRLD